jgi:hypothetical protein
VHVHFIKFICRNLYTVSQHDTTINGSTLLSLYSTICIFFNTKTVGKAPTISFSHLQKGGGQWTMVLSSSSYSS